MFSWWKNFSGRLEAGRQTYCLLTHLLLHLNNTYWLSPQPRSHVRCWGRTCKRDTTWARKVPPFWRGRPICQWSLHTRAGDVWDRRSVEFWERPWEGHQRSHESPLVSEVACCLAPATHRSGPLLFSMVDVFMTKQLKEGCMCVFMCIRNDPAQIEGRWCGFQWQGPPYRLSSGGLGTSALSSVPRKPEITVSVKTMKRYGYLPRI